MLHSENPSDTQPTVEVEDRREVGCSENVIAGADESDEKGDDDTGSLDDVSSSSGQAGASDVETCEEDENDDLPF